MPVTVTGLVKDGIDAPVAELPLRVVSPDPHGTIVFHSRADLTPCISANDDLKIWVRKEPGGRGEEGKVQRTADHRNSETGGSRNEGYRAVSQARDQPVDVLSAVTSR